jgi:hypothetical protein
MVSKMPDTANTFAESACKLLTEYTARLIAQKQEVVKILDQFYSAGPRGPKFERYMSQRYDDERHMFMRSREVFERLIRKTSQWVEHGKTPEPHLEMELEVRLADLESTLQSMEHFFHANQI